MSCGKVHTRRKVARRTVNRHAVPVARRAATPTGKGVVTRVKATATPVRRGKTSKRLVVKVAKRNQFKFTRAGFLAWLKKQQHPAVHKVSCQAKLRTAVVVRKKVKVRQLQRPFKAPLKVKASTASKSQVNLKSRKALHLRLLKTFDKVKKRITMPIVTVQSFLLNLLDGLELPYGMPALEGNITPPDPRVKAKIPAAYIWPSPGDENRSAELGGTLPRNSGFGTPSGTKGIMHHFDIYVTWTGARNKGRQTDPLFPGVVDAVMAALRYSTPNPAYLTDPNTGLTSTVYNVGEVMHYQVGLEDLADERLMRYDCLVTCSVWEILNA